MHIRIIWIESFLTIVLVVESDLMQIFGFGEKEEIVESSSSRTRMCYSEEISNR